jgi:glucose-6-phosphate isomerase
MEKNNSLNNSEAVPKLKEKFLSLENVHLRNLLQDKERNKSLLITTDRILFDFSHEKLDSEVIDLLIQVAKERNVIEKFKNMFSGEKINSTEKRRVLHNILRSGKEEKFEVDGEDLVKGVHEVLSQVKSFSDDIRTGKKVGFTCKKLKKIICLGIGGSYLGTDFVYNSLKSHKAYSRLADDFDLRFLANVCPIDFSRATHHIDIEETLIIIISKTFTTAETMLNARNCKNWLLKEYQKKYPYLADEDLKVIISKHFAAVSTNLEETSKFGIDSENVFGFWDWVGGRYSVWSAVGALPLSIVFGFETFQEFLKGGRDIDSSIQVVIKSGNYSDLRNNIPILLGLIGFFNAFILGLSTRAILPYSQALCKFANHIQQVDMESNGKGVSVSTNSFVDYECGPIVFGEPGTNGQHSFYQLIHQGRKLACEFIAHAQPQVDVKFDEFKNAVSNHEELMCNFFAQPDALAYGKFTSDDLSGISKELINHKTFKGDRPSLSILLRELDAFAVGQLLAIYEHRIATEGFIYDVNSFDQWGVELGKVLANEVRKVIGDVEEHEKIPQKFNSATANLMQFFIQNK